MLSHHVGVAGDGVQLLECRAGVCRTRLVRPITICASED